MTDKELVEELYKRFTTLHSDYYCGGDVFRIAEQSYGMGGRLNTEAHSSYQLAYALVVLRKFIQ